MGAMLEKRQMWLVNGNEPWNKPSKVDILFNTETNSVEMCTDSYLWHTPGKGDYFFDSESEAKEEHETLRKRLLEKMADVKNYLAIMHNWHYQADAPFTLKDFLPTCLLPNDESQDDEEEGEEKRRLWEYVRTGMICLNAESFRKEDVLRIRFGEDMAELTLRDGHEVLTCDDVEFKFVCDMFGDNVSDKVFKTLE
jgi:hypothetical protein